MLDARVANLVAEKRITKAKATSAKVLSLSPNYTSDGGFARNHEPRLAALSNIPLSVASLENVETIHLDGTAIADVTSLSKMQRLRNLNLRFTPISDLSPLSGLDNIEGLNLSLTLVVDLAPLSNLKTLKGVDLSQTKVSDLSHLCALHNLEELGLENLTDLDLSPLVASGAAWETEDRQLSQIRISNTHLSAYAPGSNSSEASSVLATLREMRGDQWVDEKKAVPGSYVFLSYARAETDAAKRIREMLEGAGIAVVQDIDFPRTGAWRDRIKTEIERAGAVLTLWSHASATSDYVRAEAALGRARGKLASARIDGIAPNDLPMPFGEDNLTDLSAWPDTGEAERAALISTLRDMMLGASGGIGVSKGEDGKLHAFQRPMGAAPARDDPDPRARVLAAQLKLTLRTARQVTTALGPDGSANFHKDLPERLREYGEELAPQERHFWEEIDDAFASAKGLMNAHEGDDGIGDAFTRLIARHNELKEFVAPVAPDAPTPDETPPPEAEPDFAEEAVPKLRAVRDLTDDEMAAYIGADVGEVLGDVTDRIEREMKREAWTPSESDAQRTRLGRLSRTALGITGSLSAALGIHGYMYSPAAQSLGKALRTAIDWLAKLTPP